jgi:hypothetical protein
MRLVGLLLNAAGVAALWFGGVPYRTNEKIIDVGPIHASAEVEKKAEIPPPVGAGLVAVGSALLLLAPMRRK